MNKTKKIAVFTSIRSEYGVLVPLLRILKSHPDFDLKLLVAGAHLLNEHGHTIDEINKDGFTIDCKFPFLFSDNEKTVNTRSMSLLQMQIGEYLVNQSPDLLIVIGDRFELLPVVSSALVLNIPIAHLSGGDVTEGANDNQIRNAVSKMSHIHFTGTEKSRNNLIKMGEEEWRIYNTGEPGIDSILSIVPLKKEEIYNEFHLDLNKKLVIVTFHPETINNTITYSFIMSLFQNLIIKFPNYQFLITSSNFDKGGVEINNACLELAEKNENIFFRKSLGQRKYYSILNYAEFMLGNSSSGIIEAQSFKLPVINVGIRQQGRERNINTIDVKSDIFEIEKTIIQLENSDFTIKINNSKNIYGDGNCANQIVSILYNLKFDSLLLKKNTY